MSHMTIYSVQFITLFQFNCDKLFIHINVLLIIKYITKSMIVFTWIKFNVFYGIFSLVDSIFFFYKPFIVHLIPIQTTIIFGFVKI